MGGKSSKFGIKLLELAENESDIIGSYKLLIENNELLDSLKSHAVDLNEKKKVIDKVFPNSMKDFFYSIAENNLFNDIKKIFDIYDKEKMKKNNIVEAILTYVVKPSEDDIKRVKNFVKDKYLANDVVLKLIEDKNLIGGNVLQVGDKLYINNIESNFENIKLSLKETLKQEKSASVKDIISALKGSIENYEVKMQEEESGVITYIGDGIATIYGLNHVMYGEVITFENGLKGMVQDIRREQIGCILFGEPDGLREGSRAFRTYERANVPVGDAFVGRVVNALGEPIDGKGTIESDEFREIEQEAPGIIERQSVSVPLETGLLSIDSMIPIGRGQRELIIGDRQTGKTSIAIDTILNQKGKDVICIYVAIGQKASTVAKVVSTLTKYDSMDYSIIVSATADEIASMQYIAPYSATSIAEYFMYKGKDVLIVYDDLSKHAVAYRALSLLLERSPGREAYPGDVFYLHSRLLERSCRLNEERGGGSITSLPIIETLAGDVSAYIPTNVISITDGQIFLESDLFFAGVRPAVNVGLSVSRVGGSAQTKAMKRAAGSLRIDLAQFREMEIFTQFSSDLDESTKEQLSYGNTLMELIKQPLYHPLSLSKQIISLCVATHKLLTDVPLKEIKKFINDLLEYMDNFHGEISKEIESGQILTDELIEKIIKVTKEFKSR